MSLFLKEGGSCLSALPDPSVLPMPTPGTPLAGRYRVLDPLPSPSPLIPLRARDLYRDENVSLYLFPHALEVELSKSFQTLRERIHRLQAVRSPWLLNILDSGDEDHAFFFVEEQPRGRSLWLAMEDLRASREICTPELAVGISWLLCRALAVIHRTGPHGFLNPEEIFLEAWPEGPIPFHPRVSRVGVRAAFRLHPFGTEGIKPEPSCYAPPEFAGPSPLQAGADSYGVGAILYSLLTSRFPSGQFIRPSTLRAGLSRVLDEIVLRALEEDPEGRFESPQELAAVLAPQARINYLREALREEERRLAVRPSLEPAVSSLSLELDTREAAGSVPGSAFPLPPPSRELVMRSNGRAAASDLRGSGAAQAAPEVPQAVVGSIFSAGGWLRRWVSVVLVGMALLLLLIAGWKLLTRGGGVGDRLSQLQKWESVFRESETRPR